jgi:N-acetylglucosamine-6-phosphate deacetylase
VTLVLSGGSIVTRSGVEQASVCLEGPVIASVGSEVAGADDVLDVSGLLISAGFIDLQLNGAHGMDLTDDPLNLWDVAAVLPRYGVTSFLPTMITAEPARYGQALDVLGAGPPAGWYGAMPLGWHFEGPMLNPARKGAHPARLLVEPNPELYGRWSHAAGVALVTLAPELPGGLDAVRTLHAAGVVVSAGHTAASTVEIDASIDAGVTYLTHLFNAMVPFAHREPGPIGVALAGPPLVCGLIADGIHVHPTAVRAAWGALGCDRLNLVTDAVGALGMPRGPYRLGAIEVSVGPDGVRNADGTLAGSNLAMDEAVRNLMLFTGCALHEAVATVTATPARVLGRSDKGCIESGAAADLAVLTPELEVVATIVGGEIVHRTRELAWRS